jgi:glucose-1-phosphate thymidylyltransferase
VKVAGIIPAAGYAARVQPLHCSKEVYPIRGRPVMDHLIERMRAAQCRDIRVVTRPDKVDVVRNSREQATTVVEGHPRSLAASIQLGLTGLADPYVVLLGFPDTIWEPPDGFATLLGAVERGWDAALGLFPVDDPETCDVVRCDAHDRVIAIEPRPARPSSNVIWGCAAIRLDLLRGWNGAVDPGIYLDSIAGSHRLIGIRLSDDFVDIGKSRRVLREASR